MQRKRKKIERDPFFFDVLSLHTPYRARAGDQQTGAKGTRVSGVSKAWLGAGLPQGIDVHGLPAAGTPMHGVDACLICRDDVGAQQSGTAWEICHQKSRAALTIPLLHRAASWFGIPSHRNGVGV